MQFSDEVGALTINQLRGFRDGLERALDVYSRDAAVFQTALATEASAIIDHRTGYDTDADAEYSASKLCALVVCGEAFNEGVEGVAEKIAIMLGITRLALSRRASAAAKALVSQVDFARASMLGDPED